MNFLKMISQLEDNEALLLAALQNSYKLKEELRGYVNGPAPPKGGNKFELPDEIKQKVLAKRLQTALKKSA